MRSRYQQLRQAVATLASPAEEQIRYLDESFASLTGGGDAASYGNDELALEFGDVFPAADDMIACGELTPAEMEAIRPLDALLAELSGEDKADVWRREALLHDPRWTQVRACAARTLVSLPDEERVVD